MQKISFSVNHPNLSLETATLLNNGQLRIKIKFVGNPPINKVISTLNYTYSDDFSSFSGNFPIEVNGAPSNIQGFSFVNQANISTCNFINSFYCTYNHIVTFTGGSPLGGNIYYKTHWDNNNDGIFEDSTGSSSFSCTVQA